MRSNDSAQPAPTHTDVCLWLDYYGELLSERQRQVLTLYYDEDLSLSEIADVAGLSRQGVHGHIRKGVAKLMQFETTLRLATRDGAIAERLSDALDHMGADDAARPPIMDALRMLGCSRRDA